MLSFYFAGEDVQELNLIFIFGKCRLSALFFDAVTLHIYKLCLCAEIEYFYH